MSGQSSNGVNVKLAVVLALVAMPFSLEAKTRTVSASITSMSSPIPSPTPAPSTMPPRTEPPPLPTFGPPEKVYNPWMLAAIGGVGLLILVILVFLCLKMRVQVDAPQRPIRTHELERKLLSRGSSPDGSPKSKKKRKGRTRRNSLEEEVARHEQSELAALGWSPRGTTQCRGADAHLQEWLSGCQLAEDAVE